MTSTFGIEEEYFLVDAGSGDLVSRAGEVLGRAHDLAGDQVTSELNHCQLESNTTTCTDLDEATGQLVGLRRALAEAAEGSAAIPVALGSHPWSSWHDQEVNTDKEHYRTLVDRYQHVARSQVICGCHVHVAVDELDARIEVMNGVRPWLPVLLALSANSPWWEGADTGYASYRTLLWRAWPTAAMPTLLKDFADYERLVGSLEQVGAIDDASALYWYVRPSAKLPTLEYRVCDVCLLVEDTITIAGVVRALTVATLTGAAGAVPTPTVAVLDAALWRAARYGLEGDLVDPLTVTLQPAATVVAHLVDLVSDALHDAGDYQRVTGGISEILRRGNGATAQRRALDHFPDPGGALDGLRAMQAVDGIAG
ncbi:MAG TPA: glutamate--cysteine ligase [Acidimicrobiales bacterium]|jgi:carboxylate-amine ligase|nr:glutamate--cysteine ligase [Acidimicrobiales bacterium]